MLKAPAAAVARPALATAPMSSDRQPAGRLAGAAKSTLILSNVADARVAASWLDTTSPTWTAAGSVIATWPALVQLVPLLEVHALTTPPARVSLSQSAAAPAVRML